jgi:hypothetical protein
MIASLDRELNTREALECGASSAAFLLHLRDRELNPREALECGASSAAFLSCQDGVS